MILGHAAGVAAALAIRAGTSVQDVDVKELARILVSQGAILEYVASAQERADRHLPDEAEVSGGWGKNGFVGRAVSGLVCWW